MALIRTFVLLLYLAAMVKAISSEDDLVRELSAAGGRLVVVDFWAKWCGPCMAFAPVFDAIAAEYAGRDEPVVFLKVEDTAADCHQARGIRALPTFQLYLKGAKVDEVRGTERKGVGGLGFGFWVLGFGFPNPKARKGRWGVSLGFCVP